MKQSLQLKVSQQLTMTPQLQQAIKLLQLSTLDLQQEIQAAIDSNPMLEVSEDDSPDADSAQADNNSKDTEPTANSADRDSVSVDETWNEGIPDDLPVDSRWEDIYQPATTPSRQSSSDNPDFDVVSRSSSDESLQDHLRWQLNLSRMSDVDRVIAMAIIDAIAPDGRLTCDIEDILDSVADNPELDIEEDEVLAVLHRIQQFDPPGVAARDLRECLLIQLQQLPDDTEWLKPAKDIVTHHLDLLGSRDYNQLMRRSRVNEEQLKQVLKLIQTLNPTPGVMISPSDTEYVVPDVFVTKHQDTWVVELNPDIAPKLRINDHYASLTKQCSSADSSYIRDNLQEARWFLKSLQSRNETLMKVASKIVEYQRGFLEYGEEAMKPMILHDIAEAVEMHESTISRVTTQKYMHTPRGIYELKYFFSSHVSTDAGGECSSTAIRALIKKLIAAENPRKPLSDSKITALLAEQGIQVARRTIAKYREAMVIPPSNERKRLV
ncbi:RNA polymerase sigma-54 factor [Litorivivens lipolytica]|uniref:RNA polymerase sigma-54 factor n=1 Tax=Litorivivens lipolytica TaxID=1524264 RepID=A0A7W4W4P7_9GAMM|nr:RNA polymerase factor sigma-54 [Litorivivens lipolytica]MBB3047113.1 RNA polymerase sigma-54 factor [Litorivivens lipolytica]